MPGLKTRPPLFFACLLLVAVVALPSAQTTPQVSPSLFQEMKWRNIGPFRAGRTKAAAGHRSQPFTFYIGMVNGGVWKTTDAGRTWKPIFEDQPTGSIGAIAVAPSDANVVYVGTGEGLPRPDLAVGDGMYKSTDAGKTWTHLGLRDAQQIPKIAVDPTDPNRLFVAALGHPYGPNKERGIFRSTDGGRTFQQVLFKNEDTGGKDVDIDPANPQIVYATMWEQRQGPWENGAWSGMNGGLFKSTDGGMTWTQMKQGLPDGVINAELAIAPSNPRRLYVTLEAGAGGTGLYRSDDAGATWARATTDNRPTSRINEVVPHVHPKDADTIVVTDIVSFKSTDGGKTFVPFKGAPGGDDNQNIWWNPDNPDIMLLVIDQGAVVTLNGGQTWSSWFTQSTAALYHVMTDNAFPYRVCGGQQDSGSVCVASRGTDGQITFREWHPVGVEEYGYAAPDPLDPDLVYGGKVTRYDRRTAQVSDVGPVGRGGGAGGPGGGPAAPAYRTVRTQPVVFSQVDKRTLYYGNNVLWKTIDGGINWTQISPDLTRETWTVPKNVGSYMSRVQNTKRGAIGAQVIYTIGPSYKDINRIWIGTDDGTIATTADGGLHWTNVTPPGVTDFMKVFTIDPGRFDPLTAYAAVNTLRLDDMNPHIYRTHDGGKTWKEIVNGIPGGAPVSVVREDPVRKGLLFAGSETQVYVSFDDGDNWQSLRLNMAASSVRDLVIKDDDVVVGTHGRGIWILDNITPLRQVSATTAQQDAVLYKPQAAWRVRWNTNTDTPLPPDEPTAPNPPEGAIIDYYLKAAASGPVTLEILDGKTVLRKYSSDDEVFRPNAATTTIPLYWYREPMTLKTTAGMHRFTWDVHYQPVDGVNRVGGPALPIAAIGYNTVPVPSTPWANPGSYTVRLTVNGKSYTQPILVKQDPRVKTPALAMQQIYTQSRGAYDGAVAARLNAAQGRAWRDEIATLQPRAVGPVADALAAFDKKLEAIVGVAAGGGGGRGRGAGGGGGGAAGPGGRAGGPPPATGGSTGPPAETFATAGAALSGVMNLLQGADVRPTTVQLNAIAAARAQFTRVMTRWTTLTTVDLAAVNAKLTAAKLPVLRRP